MKDLPICQPIAMLPAKGVEWVALTRDGRERLWVAWSQAMLGGDRLGAACCHEVDWQPIALTSVEEAGRPALAVLGSGVLLMACGRTRQGVRPVGWWFDGDRQSQRFVIDSDGDVIQMALAAAPDAPWAWLAWHEISGHGYRLRVGRLVPPDRFVPMQWSCPAGHWQRSAALAMGPTTTWLSWIQGIGGEAGRVFLRQIDPPTNEPSLAVSETGAHQEAPSLAVTAANMPVAAWHARLVDHTGGASAEVFPWLSVFAATDGIRAFRQWPLDMAFPADRALAGTDQGWQRAQLAIGSDRTVWLAGRSSNGFQVVFRQCDGRWSERRCLSSDQWGGRSLQSAWCALPDGQMMLAHGEPEGLALTGLRPPTNLDRSGQCDLPEAGQPCLSETVAWPRTHANAPVGPESVQSDRMILFGDIHQHCLFSDGLGEPEEVLLAARDRYGHDFSALTDHDTLSRRAIGPLAWQQLCAATESFHQPGRFVTFAAYEFTGARSPGPGHKCVYFADRYPQRLPVKDPVSLAALLKEYGAIAVPHHTGWSGTDWSQHNPIYQPVWEICSLHGIYESQSVESAFPPRPDVILPGHFLKDALNAGLRFGFVGGTDSHGLLWHHGISPRRDSYRTGLTAVPGATRERSAIFSALRNKCCYATTGALIRMRLDLDGAPMGSELPAEIGGLLNLSVQGTCRLASVMLVRRQGEIPIGLLDGPNCHARIPVRLPTDLIWDYLYVRVRQEDHEMAWSSPIWLGSGS